MTVPDVTLSWHALGRCQKRYGLTSPDEATAFVRAQLERERSRKPQPNGRLRIFCPDIGVVVRVHPFGWEVVTTFHRRRADEEQARRAQRLSPRGDELVERLAGKLPPPSPPPQSALVGSNPFGKHDIVYRETKRGETTLREYGVVIMAGRKRVAVRFVSDASGEWVPVGSLHHATKREARAELDRLVDTMPDLAAILRKHFGTQETPTPMTDKALNTPLGSNVTHGDLIDLEPPKDPLDAARLPGPEALAPGMVTIAHAPLMNLDGSLHSLRPVGLPVPGVQRTARELLDAFGADPIETWARLAVDLHAMQLERTNAARAKVSALLAQIEAAKADCKREESRLNALEASAKGLLPKGQ